MTPLPDNLDPSSYEPLALHRGERFDVVVLAGQRPRLIVKSEWSQDIAEYMRKHELTDLSLNTGMGWKGGGIEFLADAPPLRSVAVLDWRTRDLTPLRVHRETLEELITECDVRRAPPLAELPALNRLTCDWTEGWSNVFNARGHGLRTLAIGRLPHEDLGLIDTLRSLETLVVVGGRKLRDLASLRDRESLRELGLHQCPSVTDFDVLRTCRALGIVRLSCRQLRDIEFTRSLPALEFLSLGKSDIPTLSPLQDCRALRRFSTDGQVADRDLSLLLQLPAFEWLGLPRGSQYRPTAKEINARCNHRWHP